MTTEYERAQEGAFQNGSDPDGPARLVQELLAQPAEEYTLQRVVDLAVESISGCDFAGISIRRRKGQIETPAWAGDLVLALDGAQYELDEGPCLDAIRMQDLVVIEDTASDPRWPRWAPRAAELGAFSVLSVRLATAQEVVGGLNLYSARSRAFGEDAVQVAHRYAALAGPAVAVVEQVEGLRTAMQTRHRIGMAQGMLMLRYGLSEEQAFQFLVRTSSHANTKLHTIAEGVVRELGSAGWPRQG